MNNIFIAGTVASIIVLRKIFVYFLKLISKTLKDCCTSLLSLQIKSDTRGESTSDDKHKKKRGSVPLYHPGYKDSATVDTDPNNMTAPPSEGTATKDNYVAPTVESLLEKNPNGEEKIEHFRTKLRTNFRRSNLLDEDHEILFPRFEYEEIVKGDILGIGGFGTVTAITKFNVVHHSPRNGNDSDLAAFSFRSWASVEQHEVTKPSFGESYQPHHIGIIEEDDDDEETPLDEAYYESQFQDKRFIAENATTVDTKKARYVVKYISPDIVHHDFSKFVQAATDMAMETHFLSILDHPHILKMRGVGMGDFFCPTYFLLLDRLYDTLDERIISWEESMKKCDANNFFNRLFSSSHRKEKNKHQILHEQLTVARNLADAIHYLHDLKYVLNSSILLHILIYVNICVLPFSYFLH